MRRIKDSKIVALPEGGVNKQNITPYLAANFDIEEYIKIMQGKLSTVSRLDGVLTKLETLLVDPGVLSKYDPRTLIQLYKTITTRANLEANLVSKFVDDSTKNTILKKRMLNEQKRIDRENSVYKASSNDVSDLAKSIKSIFINKERAEDRGESSMGEEEFNELIEETELENPLEEDDFADEGDLRDLT